MRLAQTPARVNVRTVDLDGVRDELRSIENVCREARTSRDSRVLFGGRSNCTSGK
jgi:hypothetical protein